MSVEKNCFRTNINSTNVYYLNISLIFICIALYTKTLKNINSTIVYYLNINLIFICIELYTEKHALNQTKYYKTILYRILDI